MNALLAALLALLEQDAALDFGPILIGFLTDIENAKGDPIKMAAAWVKLQGSMVAEAPTALGDFTSQLASLIVSKVQALLAKVPAPVAAPAAVTSTPAIFPHS